MFIADDSMGHNRRRAQVGDSSTHGTNKTSLPVVSQQLDQCGAWKTAFLSHLLPCGLRIKARLLISGLSSQHSN